MIFSLPVDKLLALMVFWIYMSICTVGDIELAPISTSVKGDLGFRSIRRYEDNID